MKPIVAGLLAFVAVVLQGCDRKLCQKSDYTSCLLGTPEYYHATASECRKLQIMASCVPCDCWGHGEPGMTPTGVNMSQYLEQMGDALTAKEVACDWQSHSRDC
mmetsp:Transcript_21288/g.35519  ORF Transcript_21288/g.35519 Transcript_21288/m.35519 type:complete len:104 (-) Transcript_21288:110-421(-)